MKKQTEKEHNKRAEENRHNTFMFKAEKENDKKERQAMAELEAKRMKDKQTQLIKQNEPKVNQRQQEHINTLEHRVETIQQKAVAGIERQTKLDVAVENYACRPDVEIDRNRVIKETETRLIRKETIYDKADKVEIYAKHGYTVDTLMKDIRFKVNAALTNANLADTSYGKQVLRGLPASNSQSL